MEKAAFLCKKVFENETLAFADDLQRYQNYAACGLKSAAPSCQKMWKLEKIEYISNHVYKNVAIYQKVLSRDAI